MTGQTAFTKAVELIRQLVRSGEMVPGGRLPSERQLAEEFGLARSSVREAIRALAEQGILESRRGAGTYLAAASGEILLRRLAEVAQGQSTRVAQVFEFRRMLEPQLVRRAVANATDTQLDRMRLAVRRQQLDIESGGTGRRQDRQFHRLVAEATGNPLAVEAVHSLASLFDVPRARQFDSPARDRASLESHMRVLAAIEARDADLAAREMERHLSEVEQMICGDQEQAQRPAKP
ncbi:MAG: FadR family transcriptional regulator [Proteobacteria bacterium]|nr:FadR family transcriptional regulator [Pseudomonadota bacterium]